MSTLHKGIAVVGSTTIDEIVSQRQRVTKIGGVTAYAGITYSRHGIETQVISNIASGDRNIISQLEREKIVVHNGPTNRTTYFINDIRQDSRRLELFSRARSIQPHQLSKVIKYVDALHLGPLHPDDIEPEALIALTNTDLKIFLDVQGYTRRVVSSQVSAAVSRHLTIALNAADIIKANGNELNLIVDHYQQNITEIMKSFDIEESVITLGQDGGWVESKESGKFEFSATGVEAVADPTGAGDVFFAAYLVSRFLNNQNIADACLYAASTAGRQVAGKHITFDRLALH
jgi:sugar/nucleoside kinase (ribokinase family)